MTRGRENVWASDLWGLDQLEVGHLLVFVRSLVVVPVRSKAGEDALAAFLGALLLVSIV